MQSTKICADVCQVASKNEVDRYRGVITKLVWFYSVVTPTSIVSGISTNTEFTLRRCIWGYYMYPIRTEQNCSTASSFSKVF